MAQYIKTEDGYKDLEESVSKIVDPVNAELSDKISNIEINLTNKMDKINPTGTGSFSLNRKANTTVGNRSFAEGYLTTASGNYSHAEGNDTTASGFNSHAEGNNTKATSTNDSTTITFSPDKGYYTHAEGYGTVAYGRCSHAEGNGTKASGNDSHSEGYGTVAYGTCSHAEGDGTIASGTSSHAEGYKTTASGNYSHAEGYSTNMFSSVVTTNRPTTDDIINVWKNKKFSVAKGYYSHVEGWDNLALYDYSHAEGYQTTASGNYSHAEGSNTTASGDGSHAEGYHTTASKYCSHAEGYLTSASGRLSHAEGNYTIASGNNSHAEGFSTKASGDYSHVQGKYNIEDTSNKYADIIGNGTSGTARSNAATVDWNGNVWFAGDAYTGSTSGTNKDDGSKKLATEEYVNSSIAATSVLYTAQSLTDEQKVQARQNIGAQDLYNGLTPVSYSCTDGTYSVSDTVYLESGNIISPIDTVSNDVRIAFRYINFWSIPAQLDVWKNDIKRYKLLIDNGYLENNTIWYSKPDKKLKKQIRFGTNSRVGNYIIFNFNYDYEVIGQLVYYVDTDTISTGIDTYLNYNLKRDKNNVLSYSAIKLASDPTEPMQIATKHYVDNAIANIPATDLSNCVQTNKENILGDNGSIISNSIGGNSLTISNGVIEQKNSNQDSVSLGNAKVVFSHDNDGSSSTRGNGTFTMYGRKGEEYFKFNGTNGDVRVSGIATPTLQNDAVNKSYVDSQIANIKIPTVPTNVSAFTNDAGYLTEHQSLADYALKSEIPSPYSLPTASATELGGVKADPATADDIQPVRIDNSGKLVTAARSGSDISLGLTSASVGQIIKVKAIDESGKPTAWEAADISAGGGWELITDVTLTEDGGSANQFILTRNDKGENFEYRQCMVCLSGKVIDGWPKGAYIALNLYESNELTGSNASVSLSRLAAGAGGTDYKTTVEISIFGNLVRIIACGGSADTSSLIIRNDASIDTFRSIKITSYGNNQWVNVPLAAGGRVVIYGRK